jgi:hypothetical protein
MTIALTRATTLSRIMRGPHNRLAESGINDVNEADRLNHAARCRWLARALSDEAARRVMLDFAAECETMAATLRRDNERGLAVALVPGA